MFPFNKGNLPLPNSKSCIFRKVDKAWIGLNDIKKDGDWKWLSGESKFTKWGSYGPEPNGGTDENCVTLRTYDNGWADYNCGNTFAFFCEVGKSLIFYCNIITVISLDLVRVFSSIT